jgi:hypothetical protein
MEEDRLKTVRKLRLRGRQDREEEREEDRRKTVRKTARKTRHGGRQEEDG